VFRWGQPLDGAFAIQTKVEMIDKNANIFMEYLQRKNRGEKKKKHNSHNEPKPSLSMIDHA